MTDGSSVHARSTDRSAGPVMYRAFLPGHGRQRPLVLIHGNSRSSGRQFRAFLPMALHLGVPLIAPTFDRESYAGFQRLAGTNGPFAAYQALLDVLEDAHERLDLDTTTIDLAGYSAGAQFAHRFALFAPERVRHMVAGAAGWFTYLDAEASFPQGVRTAGGSSPAADVAAFLKVSTLVVVGEYDTHQDPGLRRGRGLDRVQGPNRLVRSLRWVDHVEACAQEHGIDPGITFDLIPGVGHGLAAATQQGGYVSQVLTHVRGGETLLVDQAAGEGEGRQAP